MNADLNNLIKIAQIDKEASLKEPEIAKIENTLNIKLKEHSDLENTLEEITNSIKKAKVDISSNELLIQENKDKIEQIEKKVLNAKSERELRALDAENGLAKEKITFANEMIGKLEKEISNLKDKEDEVLNSIDSIKKEIETIKIDVEKNTSLIRDELKKIFNKKDEIAKNIDNKVIVFYEKIRKWAKDTSVVPVKKQACSGCFIKINDRIYSELNKLDTIITCPHCGRILFIEE